MSTDALTLRGRPRRVTARPRGPQVPALVALLAAVLGVAPVASARQPGAADRATARALAYAGQRALDCKDYQGALDRFTRANELVPAPTLALRIARAEVGLGKLVEAQETYQRIIRTGVAPGSPPVFRQALEDAKKEVAVLAPRLCWATIKVVGPRDPTVTIDGTRLPGPELGVRRAVDPGVHLVHVTLAGYEPLDSRFSIAEGQARSVTLAPTRAVVSGSGKRSAWHRTAGFTALGVGTAALIVGSIEGAVAISKHAQLGKACPGGTCPPDQSSRLDSYRTAGTISTAGFIVAAVGYGAGMALLLTTPEKTDTGYVAPCVGLGTLGAKGRF